MKRVGERFGEMLCKRLGERFVEMLCNRLGEILDPTMILLQASRVFYYYCCYNSNQ